MATYLIQPAETLRGECAVSVSKNAVLPVMAASLLTRETLEIPRVPELTDVRVMAELLSACGARVSRGDFGLRVEAANPVCPPVAPGMRAMRASILILGPLLARMGEAVVGLPGGCAIGQRPIDIHIKGMQAMGAEVAERAGGLYLRGRLRGANIYLDFPSVGATENLMMAATLADGVTRIENAAKEPEITDLAACLNAMGARVSGAGTGALSVEGVRALHGACHTPIPDRVEAGTLACAAAMTGGSVMLRGARPDHMRALLYKLRETGVIVEDDARGLLVRGRARSPVEVRTLSYPGFPTDLQAPMMAVALTCAGTSLFLETIFENRYMHAVEMRRMGAAIRIEDRVAIVEGGRTLRGAEVNGTDLRAAAALMLCGLRATGETTLRDAPGHLVRGYEGLECKLSALGARVTRSDG